jgi:Fic/DOC family
VAFRDFSRPEHVIRDYESLMADSHQLLSEMKPPPRADANPEDSSHWPDDADATAWCQRAMFIAHFHVRFIFIHPFKNGNGRVSRLIAWGQAQRLFPEVSSRRFGRQTIESKENPYLPDTFGDTAIFYLQAFKHLKPGFNCNFSSLMKYFMFQRDITVPENFKTDTPFYIGPRLKYAARMRPGY